MTFNPQEKHKIDNTDNVNFVLLFEIVYAVRVGDMELLSSNF